MTLAQQIASVAEWLQTYVDIPPNSRLQKFQNVLLSPDGSAAAYIPIHDPNFAAAREAVRDVQILNFVREQFINFPNGPKFRTLLRNMLLDPTRPEEDPRNSQGRDAQHELYVAAVCQNAQLHPTFQEPDLRCICADRTVAIAIKRCKSAQQLGARLDHASRIQIPASNLPGVVVIDISLILNPNNLVVSRDVGEQQFSADARFNFEDFLGQYGEEIDQSTRSSPCLGLILSSSVSARNGTTTVSTHFPGPMNSTANREAPSASSSPPSKMAWPPHRINCDNE